jgi:hypothetical protein
MKFLARFRLLNRDGYVYSMEVWADNEAEAADRARACVERVYGPDAFESLDSLEAVNDGVPSVAQLEHECLPSIKQMEREIARGVNQWVEPEASI